MHPVALGKCLIGKAPTKTIISLVANDLESTRIFIDLLKQEKPDVVEWRLDYLALPKKESDWLAFLKPITQALKSVKLPFIYTYRSQKEGGLGTLNPELQLELLQIVLTYFQIEGLDLEWRAPTKLQKEMIQLAKIQKIPIIYSHHQLKFDGDLSKVSANLAQMTQQPVQLLKYVISLEDKNACPSIIALAQKAQTIYKQPCLLFAQGEAGIATRISGYKHGLVASFGALQTSSAPGQLPLHELKSALLLNS